MTTTSTTSRDGASTTVAIDEEWNDSLAGALRPLADVLPNYARDVDAWSTGEMSASDLTATLDTVEPIVRRVRDSVDDLEAHPRDPLARPLVVHSADLYVIALRAHRIALETSGDISMQYDHLGRRLRILGDRIFDRARERTAAPVDPGEGVTLELPAEVPDWTRVGVAVGPPLEAEDTNQDGALPRQREEERSSQSESDWLDAVADLNAPEPEEVRSARGDEAALAEHARALVAAAEALRDVPVPEHDRGRADRLALGWLVLADAARSAQLETLTGHGTALVDVLLEMAATPELGVGS